MTTSSANRLSRRKALQVKICGATEASELHALDEIGADYAGLWFHVPHGRYSLDHKRFQDLARTPLRRLRCIGVTTESDPDAIVNVINGSGISGVQLHGFQLPKVVQLIRRRLDERIELFKVLHVQRGKCLERPLLKEYAFCGAEAFIVDNFVSRQRPGSTGERISWEKVGELAGILGTERLFLAGGIDEAAIKNLHSYGRLRGVDIDSGARVGPRIEMGLVNAIVTAARKTSG